jgi:hypothetical protein
MFDASLLADPSTPQPDAHAGVEVLLDRRDAGGEPHVRAGAVRDPGTRPGELADLVVVDVYGVGEPDVVAEPIHGLHPRYRALLEAREREELLVEGLAEVGVKAHAVARASAAVSRSSSGVTEKGEQGASTIWVIEPWRRRGKPRSPASESSRIAASSSTTLSGGSPPWTRRGTWSRGGVEPHADLLCCRDLVVEPAAVRKDVRVIEDGRAAGRGELGQADESAPARRLGSPAAPDQIVGPKPGEQVDVLAMRERAGQRLVEVVVSIHEAGQQDLARHVQHDVGVTRKLLGGADLLDNPISDEQTGIVEFATPIVHRDQDIGVPRQQR